MGYIFDSHYGTSSLADEETRLVIEWDNGNYKATRKIHFDGDWTDANTPENKETVEAMEAHIKENYEDYM